MPPNSIRFQFSQLIRSVSANPLERLGCDLALWEVSPQLLDGVRDRLRGVQRIEGDRLRAELGTWHGRKVLIASASPASVADMPLSPLFESMVSTHRPTHWCLVGEAACRGQEIASRQMAYATEVVDSEGNRQPMSLRDEDLALLEDWTSGPFIEGPARLSDFSDGEEFVVADWATTACDALVQSGLSAPLLAALVPGQEQAGQLLPPTEPVKASLSRQTGRMLGKLWRRPQELKSMLGQQTDYWRRQRELADQIESIVQRITL